MAFKGKRVGKEKIPYLMIPYDVSDRRIVWSSLIRYSYSKSINVKSRVPVILLLVILSGASKSYIIS